MIADDETMRGKTICPFLRTALKADIIEFDGTTASLDAVEKVLGDGPDGFGRVGRLFAELNHRPPGTPSGRFDAVNLVGSKGDHPGDSKILSRTGFDAARFEDFTKNARTAPDGRRYLTAKEIGVAIAEDLLSDQASRVGIDLRGDDMRTSAGEFGLLLEGFGKPLTDAAGKVEQVIFVDDMRLLFESNEFPAGWQETVRAASKHGWLATSFGFVARGGIYEEAVSAYHRLHQAHRG